MKFLFLGCLLAVYSCNNSGKEIGNQLSGADSLVIKFNEKSTLQITKTVTTKESKAISKLRQFLKGKKTEAFKCGYDGNLMFYKKGNLLGDFSFNYSDEGCLHFIQLRGEELQSTAMSHEAVDFLRALAEGRTAY